MSRYDNLVNSKRPRAQMAKVLPRIKAAMSLCDLVRYNLTNARYSNNTNGSDGRTKCTKALLIEWGYLI